MKKNLIIRSGSLRMGGLERVLIEVLQNISKKKYNIFLIIEDNSGDENIFLDQVPKEIPVYFLKSKRMIEKTAYHRNRKESLYHKVLYNYYMDKEHKYVVTKTQEVISQIEKKVGKIDVFLDYDWGARRYVDKLDAKKKIIWIHNSIPKLLNKKSKIKRFGKNLNKYDVIVGICDDMKNEIDEIYPYLKNKTRRIYNPFNFERILLLKDNDLDLSKVEKEMLKENYMVAVSRLDIVQKDYETLLKGYALALEKGISEKLYIVGDGPGRSQIEKWIIDLKLQDKVKLLGNKNNPYIWMKNAKLFVHSSKYEGLPTVLIEAMICGKVVLSSNCPTGPFEILQGGKDGVLFKVGDYKDLSKKLDLLLNNNDEIKRYEKRLVKSTERFKNDIVISEYEKIID